MLDNWMESAGMVRVQARRLRRAGFDLGELYVAGLWGLYQAAQRFDPTAGVKFENFATARVRGEITDWIRTRQPRHRDGQPRPAVDLFDETFDHPVRDRGMAALEARDYLAANGHDPDQDIPKPRWGEGKGRLNLSARAKLLGISPSALHARVRRYGLEKALAMGN